MFGDFEAERRQSSFRELKAFPAYRRLSMFLLNAHEIGAEYGVQAVAMSPEGLFVFVERPLLGETPFQGFAAEVPVKLRVTGRIIAASHHGEQIWNAKHTETGTFGCVVEDALRQRFGLTCDHVAGTLAGQTPGDAVDCRKLLNYKFRRGSSVVLSTSASNRVDAALIELGKPAKTTIVGPPSGANRALPLGATVSKSGAATAVTTGVFSYIVTMVVPYATGRARFVDQIGIDGGGVLFADQGDSGAVVLDSAGRVAGLLFAAAPQSCLGFANPIDDVEAELGVSII